MNSPGWSYDAFCDALGGASAVSSRASQDDVAFLFPRQDDPRFVLEVFWLKWRLFRALCRGTVDRYQRSAAPHLALSPSTVRVALSEPSEVAPRFWNFHLSLDDQTAAQPFRGADAPERIAARLFEPSGPTDPLFASPVLSTFALGREEPVTALVLSSEVLRESGAETSGVVRGLVEVHLVSDALKSLRCSANDGFCIRLEAPGQPDATVDLWADQARASTRGVIVKGTTVPLDATTWARFQRAGQTVFSQSRAVFYPTFHVPCDVFSLGMLLFRGLLVNEEQDTARVACGVGEVAQRLAPMVEGLGPGDRALLGKRLRERLADEPVAFGSSAILFAQGDRAVGGSLPDYLWYDALLLGFRLVTNLADFSLCRDHGDYDPADPAGRLRQLAYAVDDLEQRIRAELFGAPGRDRELREACAVVKRELTAVGEGQ